jgi:hypothetical protein
MFHKIKTYATKNLWLWPLVVGLALRLYKITASSIWHDEAYTMWLLKYDLAGIIERTARDVHPPGYYLLAKPWVELFGTSAFSIRFFSVIFSVGIIYLVFKIVKEVWNEKAAFWASIFVAASPFMVRFGQEARMYGVVAFFTTLATYFLVKMIKEKNYKYLYAYAPSLLVAMYNQYYAFFVIISHWVILSIYTKGFWSFKWAQAVKEKIGVLSWKWWLANAALLIGYSPWFFTAYKQVTRVSGSYWIKPEWITFRTIPNNILQFGLYTHLDDLYNWNQIIGVATWVLLVFVGIFAGLLIFKDKERKAANLSLMIFGYLPMVLVYLLSELKTPVYQDRYFPFAAVAIFTIWALVVAGIRNKYLRYTAAAWVLGLLLVGNYVLHKDVDHQMSALQEAVSARIETGDKVYSGELYTYLDGAYYFGYDNIKFISEPVDGYGESSLFYDQQTIYVVSPEEARVPDRVWVIGKTGDKDYFKDENWPTHEKEVVFEEVGKSNGLKAVLYFRK